MFNNIQQAVCIVFLRFTITFDLMLDSKLDYITHILYVYMYIHYKATQAMVFIILSLVLIQKAYNQSAHYPSFETGHSRGKAIKLVHEPM